MQHSNTVTPIAFALTLNFENEKESDSWLNYEISAKCTSGSNFAHYTSGWQEGWANKLMICFVGMILSGTKINVSLAYYMKHRRDCQQLNWIFIQVRPTHSISHSGLNSKPSNCQLSVTVGHSNFDLCRHCSRVALSIWSNTCSQPQTPNWPVKGIVQNWLGYWRQLSKSNWELRI